MIMRIILFMVASMALCMMPVYAQGDDLNDLMQQNQVSNKSELKLSWASGVKNNLDSHLVTQVEKYWSSFGKKKYFQCYSMFNTHYKDSVDFDKYLNQKRMDVLKLRVDSVQTSGDKCAVFFMTYHGQGGMFDIPNIKMRQFWYLENGQWVIFKDPQQELKQMGFSSPQFRTKGESTPCEELLNKLTSAVSPKGDKEVTPPEKPVKPEKESVSLKESNK
jgi:hypothetical protein